VSIWDSNFPIAFRLANSPPFFHRHAMQIAELPCEAFPKTSDKNG